MLLLVRLQQGLTILVEALVATLQALLEWAQNRLPRFRQLLVRLQEVLSSLMLRVRESIGILLTVALLFGTMFVMALELYGVIVKLLHPDGLSEEASTVSEVK